MLVCWIGTRGLAISAGSAHSIVLVRTSVGKAGLMSFGSNDEGQLGHGQQVSEVTCDCIMSILHACRLHTRCSSVNAAKHVS